MVHGPLVLCYTTTFRQLFIHHGGYLYLCGNGTIAGEPQRRRSRYHLATLDSRSCLRAFVATMATVDHGRDFIRSSDMSFLDLSPDIRWEIYQYFEDFDALFYLSIESYEKFTHEVTSTLRNLATSSLASRYEIYRPSC
jgi:hypothetical protein